MDDYRARKAARVAHYRQFVEGWKSRRCTACNGSGVYDHNGTPPCGSCRGTGKERYRPDPAASQGTGESPAPQGSHHKR